MTNHIKQFRIFHILSFVLYKLQESAHQINRLLQPQRLYQSPSASSIASSSSNPASISSCAFSAVSWSTSWSFISRRVSSSSGRSSVIATSAPLLFFIRNRSGKLDPRMDTLTPAQRSKQMGLVRSRNTKPELIVRKMLSEMGFRHRLHDRKLPGQPDIVLVSQKRIIFVNGCFWHGHRCSKGRIPKTRVRFWTEKIERNKRRDARVRRKLVRMGWTTLVLWECGLKKNEAIKTRLTRFLKKKRELL